MKPQTELEKLIQQMKDTPENEISSFSITPEQKRFFMPESQKLRNFAQGATFRFSDEIEALIRSSVPGGGEYEVIRDDIRKKLKDYQKSNKIAAFTTEMAGAIIPAIIMTYSGVGAPAAGSNLLRIGGFNAAQSGLESVGASDADTTAGLATQIGAGTTAGTVIGTAFEVFLGKLGNVGKKTYNALRKKYGSGYDTAIQQELMGILESTGMNSVDDVIVAIKNGEVLGDNPVLTNEIKAMVNAGGETASTVLNLSAKRASDTENKAVTSMNQALDPEGQNVDLYARVMDAEKQDLDDIGSAYENLYGAQMPLVNDAIEARMVGILQKNRNARSVLQDIYNNDPNTTPFFSVTKNKETGADVIKIERKPNVKDAERLRRRIDTMAKKEFESASGSPDLGEQLRKVEASLREPLDKFSPELKTIRSEYADIQATVRAFNKGSREGLSGKPNINAYNTRDMPADQLESFRQGTLNAFNNQKRSTGANLQALARPGDNLNLNMQQILPRDQADQVMSDITTASNARKINQAIQPDSGSATQALQASAARREKGPSITGVDVMSASGGNPVAIIGILEDLLKRVRGKKGYTDEQTKRVAELLFSQDPDFVINALRDSTNWGKIAERAEKIAPYVMRSAQTGITQQAASLPIGLLAD